VILRPSTALLRSALRMTGSVACAFALLSIPVRGLALPSVQSGSLAHGGTYLLAPDVTAPTVAMDLWFRAPDDGYGAPVQGLARVAAAAAAATSLAGGKSLADLVQEAGGRFSISVYPDLVSVGIVVPPDAARGILGAMTAAYFAASIDTAALGAAQKDTIVDVVERQYEADVLAQDALFGKFFSSGPGAQAPVPASATDVAHVSLSDVRAFAVRAFRSSNAFLTVTGAAPSDILQAVTTGTGQATADNPIDSIVAPSATNTFTTTGSAPGVGIGWIGPAISDERAATALDFVADYLFGDNGTVTAEVRHSSSEVLLHGQFITLHDPGVMLVTLAGGNTKNAQDRVLAAVQAMQQPLDARTFASAREAFLYHMNQQTETPAEQADMLGWYAAEGAPSYAPGGANYANIAQSLDPSFVAATVRRYLSHPTIVRVTVTPSGQNGSPT
jgi:predicted Zn-dependent peptidase